MRSFVSTAQALTRTYKNTHGLEPRNLLKHASNAKQPQVSRQTPPSVTPNAPGVTRYRLFGGVFDSRFIRKMTKARTIFMTIPRDAQVFVFPRPVFQSSFIILFVVVMLLTVAHLNKNSRSQLTLARGQRLNK